MTTATPLPPLLFTSPALAEPWSTRNGNALLTVEDLLYYLNRCAHGC